METESECVILFRNTGNKRVGCVTDELGEIAVFKDYDSAEKAAHDTPVCRAFPYQIVEVDA